MIATSIPDEREWIQWKGRTARQDKPGQFCVILCEQDKLIADNLKEDRNFRSLMKQEDILGTNLQLREDKLRAVLNIHDRDAQIKMQSLGAEKLKGDVLNQLCIEYYKKYPRKKEERWPHPKWGANDKKLRTIILTAQQKGFKDGDEKLSGEAERRAIKAQASKDLAINLP